MVRDTPADMQRLECTRQVHISMAGSEITSAIFLARFGIPSAYVTRVPDNPYGWLLRDIARAQGVNTDHIVWALKAEPIGRFLYEIGRTPRRDVGWYQRMYSAASRLGAGMDGKGLAARLPVPSCLRYHLWPGSDSNYERNYLLEAFQEVMDAKPANCIVGLDFNYRATLWAKNQCTAVMTPLVTDHVDVLITTIENRLRSCTGLAAAGIVRRRSTQGDIGELGDDDIKAFAQEVNERFRTKIVAVTIRTRYV